MRNTVQVRGVLILRGTPVLYFGPSGSYRVLNVLNIRRNSFVELGAPGCETIVVSERFIRLPSERPQHFPEPQQERFHPRKDRKNENQQAAR